MPDEKVLQVAILIWGCVFCAIAAICIFLSSNYDREKRRYLILMESFASMLLLMDAMAHISLVIDDRTCFQGFKLKGAGELIPDIMGV